jgi:hypothetical protein
LPQSEIWPNVLAGAAGLNLNWEKILMKMNQQSHTHAFIEDNTNNYTTPRETYGMKTKNTLPSIALAIGSAYVLFSTPATAQDFRSEIGQYDIYFYVPSALTGNKSFRSSTVNSPRLTLGRDYLFGNSTKTTSQWAENASEDVLTEFGFQAITDDYIGMVPYQTGTSKRYKICATDGCSWSFKTDVDECTTITLGGTADFTPTIPAFTIKLSGNASRQAQLCNKRSESQNCEIKENSKYINSPDYKTAAAGVAMRWATYQAGGTRIYFSTDFIRDLKDGTNTSKTDEGFALCKDFGFNKFKGTWTTAIKTNGYCTIPVKNDTNKVYHAMVVTPSYEEAHCYITTKGNLPVKGKMLYEEEQKTTPSTR